MNATEIQTGEPKVDGRYVVFRQCESTQAREWVEPEVMTWAGKKWHISTRPILGWIGPIPVLKVADIARHVFDRPHVNALDDLGSDGEFEIEPAYDL